MAELGRSKLAKALVGIEGAIVLCIDVTAVCTKYRNYLCLDATEVRAGGTHSSVPQI